jgi:hypothetical protein
MSRNHDMDWELIERWIVEVSNENIDAIYQDNFVALVTRMTRDHFEDRYVYLKTSEYQASVLACMYIVGCFACNRPFDMETLCILCDRCYPPEEILQTIYKLICWTSPTSVLSFDTTKIHKKRTVASAGGMTCDLVSYTGAKCLLVRKRIEHWSGLPAYDAMVEVVVHYLLPTSPNVASLVHVHANDMYTDLYYEYVPTPLDMFFGIDDERMVHKVLVSLLHGVRDLHAIGIAHRDLKGLNVHVTTENQCKLLDVGSAGFGTMRETVPICTISHRSPDILKAEVDDVYYLYDGKCLDMWSIGVLILELYLGRDPFGHTDRGESAASMLLRINQYKAPVLRDVKHRCTPSQLDILSRCLDSLPENRPDIGEVLVVFETSLI